LMPPQKKKKKRKREERGVPLTEGVVRPTGQPISAGKKGKGQTPDLVLPK